MAGDKITVTVTLTGALDGACVTWLLPPSESDLAAWGEVALRMGQSENMPWRAYRDNFDRCCGLLSRSIATWTLSGVDGKPLPTSTKGVGSLSVTQIAIVTESLHEAIAQVGRA